MRRQVELKDVWQADESRDPRVVSLVQSLVAQEDPPAEPPLREGAPTFDKFIAETRSLEFRRKSLEEQAQFRVEQMQALEADDAEVPLPDRLRVHEVLLSLWERDDEFARSMLLQVIATVPLHYGPWRALKQIFKDAEAVDDTEVLGALAARFDSALADRGHQINQRTMAYLCRRGWRYLRRLGETFPAVYADACCDFLAHYNDNTRWWSTWIANHIFYHETGEYGRGQFRFKRRPANILKQRAFAELWRRSPRPLFSLLERAKSEQVRRFATSALKTDFRATLREVEAVWVARLVDVGSGTIDEFVVWILNNVPAFEQSAFRELGLHDAVLKLCDSADRSAGVYAADYIRTHARDLPVERLIQLVDNGNPAVHKVARHLLESRDPRKEIGLDAWGKLLETAGGNQLAAKALREHFGAKELTPEWFQSRILAKEDFAFQFARDNLLKIHAIEKLGHGYFCDVIEQVIPTRTPRGVAFRAPRFAMDSLEQAKPAELTAEQLQRLLVHPESFRSVLGWVETGKLKPQQFPVGFLKAVAFHPDWHADEWLTELRRTAAWAEELEFNEHLSTTVLTWLSDIRNFLPDDLGIEWLMKLVVRSEPRYHDFAVETMNKAFLPADFAPADAAGGDAASSGEGDEEITVDLGGASIVFTGKLATMTRSEAQAKVTKAGGANASSVTKKLDYLVIGDEGSPLYGQGRKGSKQVKAEKLIADGAETKIISETAFLQMLSGGVREFSEDKIQAGCEAIWEMLTGDEKPDAPLAQFARHYIRRHHPDICLAETDRPVDPGNEMPAEFMSFERFLPLFSDKRRPLRELALEIAKWEFARWSPPIEGITELCESPYEETRAFAWDALTADESPEHRRYRVDPEVLTADAVYSFCESRDAGTRAVGMELIERNPRLKLPEQLFRLTESPDRQVRAFVIRTFWSLYRNREITADWKPTPPPETTVGKKSRKAEEKEKSIGSGAPARPEQPPSTFDALRDLLRRALFEIPPGPPPKDSTARDAAKLKPLPARKSKLFLIETLRDLAVADGAFGEVVLPVLEEFMHSRGQSEMEACLVAVTRIRRTRE